MAEPTERRGQKILIVEDDPVSREALVRLLAKLGYDPVPAASVAEGLASLDGQAAAIIDLDLPDGPGTLVLERIRNTGLPVRVAVATATIDPAVLGEAAQLQPDVILPKPIDVNALLEWLERVSG